ncbi:VOC family protein [Paenibacillus durus]|uniref:VOC family protein n=1 Tax=Paenibacillus durus TaxID=44251 RepID=UPI0009DF8B49|nr:VOC family protein [Paenibacillus durus]
MMTSYRDINIIDRCTKHHFLFRNRCLFDYFSPQGNDPALKPECGVSVGFDVESLDEAIENLKSKGIPVARGPIMPNPSLRFFYILDPDGFEVQIAEHS